MVIQNQNLSTKKQQIRVVTRYQNLIRFYYWQKVVDKNKKWLLKIRTSSDFITDKYSVTKTEKVVTQNQKFITKNQRIKVITRYQNLIKICYWQKVAKKNQKVVILDKDLIIKTEKGNYSVSEPHRRD